MPEEAAIEVMQPDRWIRLDSDRYCCECSKNLEAGQRVLHFPFTNNIYCYRCSRLLTGKLEEKRRYKRGEYMPPA